MEKTQAKNRTPSEKSAPLQFKPLSSGLGFHPFSDGLPYAPATPKNSPGTGATSAGPPAFVRPAPRVVTAAPVRPATQVAAAAAAAPTVEALGTAYLAQRALAFVFDIALQTGLGTVLFWFAARQGDLTLEMIRHPSVAFVLAIFAILINWVMLTFQEVTFRTSLGKKLLGLTLDGSRGALFVRAFFFMPSFFFGGVGVLWAIVDRRKRGWHDWIADCQPMRQSHNGPRN